MGPCAVSREEVKSEPVLRGLCGVTALGKDELEPTVDLTLNTKVTTGLIPQWARP